MEPKLELVHINGKEYQLDIEQAKKLNLLKEKDSRVKSWSEFKRKYSNRLLHQTSSQLIAQDANALAAFSKLLKLRRDWIGEWEPDWLDGGNKYVIKIWKNDINLGVNDRTNAPLSFPTHQMVTEFIETFRDLIEEAKILI